MSLKLIFILKLSILTGLGFSTITLVQEDFSGEEFPPPGWIVNNGANCSWYRSTADGPTNPFARGVVSLPTGPSSGSGNLFSPLFTLCEGDTCLVDFMGRRFWEPYIPPSPSGGGWTISLKLDNTDIWQMQPPISFPWVPTSVAIPITVSASTYRFCWRLYGMLEQYISARSIYFDVDTVLIRLTAPGTEPTSLGQLKAVYKR